jgi:hypothetical protein
MNTRKRLSLGMAAAAITGGLIGAPTTSASAYPAGDVTPQSSACTRIWTGHSYGYADVCKSWYSIGGGKYEGYVKGKVHHYHAPNNRLVEVEVSYDGLIVRPTAETYTTESFGPIHYKGYKKVRIRACLHRRFADGVSVCGGWW